ncbi:AprI/Inh family metalloprotease inhibitor [Stenotrophomonas sp. HITSZ_GD]|uniref:AprI/Inh family metalloprotease inhibitor n=1 Tax=Stenotrophomonas sp. HITSZ_GD TaxID=3037248 RepID=UPI00240DE514|nr:AprI/Inh family metalloprotease inhibitor [Stenotrophomonas sp. HITSZ_GD]MDG2524933.1 AprI/Inh family metalloprotease inhibitor [Stenotrophomonas sp. HITSZ_GD]
MHARIIIVIAAAALCYAGAALAQDNTGALDQSTQTTSSSSTTTTSTTWSDDSASPQRDDSGFQSSPEMKAWIKSNADDSASRDNGFGAGFGRDNDQREDDRPSWSKHRPPAPKPEQIEGAYKVMSSTGEFLCTVNLKASPFFGGYWASTSTGCPELWKVSRWDFQGPTLVLTNSSGDIYASFWPRARDLWVGQSTASGQRLSLSR